MAFAIVCKATTTRLGARPNRNEQGSAVVRPRFAALSVTGPANELALINAVDPASARRLRDVGYVSALLQNRHRQLDLSRLRKSAAINGNRPLPGGSGFL